MPNTTLKTEAQLRKAVIDRLIAASLNASKPLREATLASWRAQPQPAPAQDANHA